ncbi:hypothetical protein FMEAI12_1160002 [Parafrankia sp. Ea1.12]|nr:hypothetical protein FMEAI12_1160002 [Parafrankia sp. Ea1.12]
MADHHAGRRTVASPQLTGPSRLLAPHRVGGIRVGPEPPQMLVHPASLPFLAGRHLPSTPAVLTPTTRTATVTQ